MGVAAFEKNDTQMMNRWRTGLVLLDVLNVLTFGAIGTHTAIPDGGQTYLNVRSQLCM